MSPPSEEDIPPQPHVEEDTQLSFFSLFMFLSVCPFVALLKLRYAENSHIVLSSRYQKAFICNLLCALICFLER